MNKVAPGQQLHAAVHIRVGHKEQVLPWPIAMLELRHQIVHRRLNKLNGMETGFVYLTVGAFVALGGKV